MTSQFIVSGERIEIRPLAEFGLNDGSPLEDRFPTLLELEQKYVQKVLAHVDGNKSRAAVVLGIDRVSLWRKLKKIESLTAVTRQLGEYPERS